MEFDSEGRIILPASMQEDRQKENNSIILTKIQINLSSPAIAHLKVEIGSGLAVDRIKLLQEIAGFCEYHAKANFRQVNSEVILSEGKSVTIIAKSSLLMYEFLNQLTADLRDRYSSQGFKITVKGSFDR